jgi:hypothetical protein
VLGVGEYSKTSAILVFGWGLRNHLVDIFSAFNYDFAVDHTMHSMIRIYTGAARGIAAPGQHFHLEAKPIGLGKNSCPAKELK